MSSIANGFGYLKSGGTIYSFDSGELTLVEDEWSSAQVQIVSEGPPSLKCANTVEVHFGRTGVSDTILMWGEVVKRTRRTTGQDAQVWQYDIYGQFFNGRKRTVNVYPRGTITESQQIAYLISESPDLIYSMNIGTDQTVSVSSRGIQYVSDAIIDFCRDRNIHFFEVQQPPMPSNYLDTIQFYRGFNAISNKSLSLLSYEEKTEDITNIGNVTDLYSSDAVIDFDPDLYTESWNGWTVRVRFGEGGPTWTLAPFTNSSHNNCTYSVSNTPQVPNGGTNVLRVYGTLTYNLGFPQMSAIDHANIEELWIYRALKSPIDLDETALFLKFWMGLGAVVSFPSPPKAELYVYLLDSPAVTPNLAANCLRATILLDSSNYVNADSIPICSIPISFQQLQITDGKDTIWSTIGAIGTINHIGFHLKFPPTNLGVGILAQTRDDPCFVLDEVYFTHFLKVSAINSASTTAWGVREYVPTKYLYNAQNASILATQATILTGELGSQEVAIRDAELAGTTGLTVGTMYTITFRNTVETYKLNEIVHSVQDGVWSTRLRMSSSPFKNPFRERSNVLKNLTKEVITAKRFIDELTAYSNLDVFGGFFGTGGGVGAYASWDGNLDIGSLNVNVGPGGRFQIGSINNIQYMNAGTIGLIEYIGNIDTCNIGVINQLDEISHVNLLNIGTIGTCGVLNAVIAHIGAIDSVTTFTASVANIGTIQSVQTLNVQNGVFGTIGSIGVIKGIGNMFVDRIQSIGQIDVINNLLNLGVIGTIGTINSVKNMVVAFESCGTLDIHSGTIDNLAVFGGTISSVLITSSTIQNLVITSMTISTLNVTSQFIGNVVTTGNIVNGAITADKIDNAAIMADNLQINVGGGINYIEFASFEEPVSQVYGFWDTVYSKSTVVSGVGFKGAKALRTTLSSDTTAVSFVTALQKVYNIGYGDDNTYLEPNIPYIMSFYGSITPTSGTGAKQYILAVGATTIDDGVTISTKGGWYRAWKTVLVPNNIGAQMSLQVRLAYAGSSSTIASTFYTDCIQLERCDSQYNTIPSSWRSKGGLEFLYDGSMFDPSLNIDIHQIIVDTISVITTISCSVMVGVSINVNIGTINNAMVGTITGNTMRFNSGSIQNNLFLGTIVGNSMDFDSGTMTNCFIGTIVGNTITIANAKVVVNLLTGYVQGNSFQFNSGTMTNAMVGTITGNSFNFYSGTMTNFFIGTISGSSIHFNAASMDVAFMGTLSGNTLTFNSGTIGNLFMSTITASSINVTSGTIGRLYMGTISGSSLNITAGSITNFQIRSIIGGTFDFTAGTVDILTVNQTGTFVSMFCMAQTVNVLSVLQNGSFNLFKGNIGTINQLSVIQSGSFSTAIISAGTISNVNISNASGAFVDADNIMNAIITLGKLAPDVASGLATVALPWTGSINTSYWSKIASSYTDSGTIIRSSVPFLLGYSTTMSVTLPTFGDYDMNARVRVYGTIAGTHDPVLSIKLNNNVLTWYGTIYSDYVNAATIVANSFAVYTFHIPNLAPDIPYTISLRQWGSADTIDVDFLQFVGGAGYQADVGNILFKIDSNHIDNLAINFNQLGSDLQAWHGSSIWYAADDNVFNSWRANLTKVVSSESQCGTVCRCTLTSVNACLYGPYVTNLAPGDYWVHFRLKAFAWLNNTDQFKLDVVEHFGGSDYTLSARVVSFNDVRVLNPLDTGYLLWKTYSLFAPGVDEGGTLEMRVYHLGTITQCNTILIDYIKVEGGGINMDTFNFQVLADQIGALQVTNSKIAALAVDSAKIAALAITNDKIDDLAVTGIKIDNLTIEGNNIKNLTLAFSKLTIPPGLQNYIANPSFESGIWEGYNKCTWYNAGTIAWDGDKVAKVNATGSVNPGVWNGIVGYSNFVPVTPGETIVMAGRFYKSDGAPTLGSFSFQYLTYDSNTVPVASYLSAVNWGYKALNVTAVSTWYQSALTLAVAAGVKYIRLSGGVVGNNVGTTIYVDAMQMNYGNQLAAFLDMSKYADAWMPDYLKTMEDNTISTASNFTTTLWMSLATLPMTIISRSKGLVFVGCNYNAGMIAPAGSAKHWGISFYITLDGTVSGTTFSYDMDQGYVMPGLACDDAFTYTKVDEFTVNPGLHTINFRAKCFPEGGSTFSLAQFGERYIRIMLGSFFDTP